MPGARLDRKKRAERPTRLFNQAPDAPNLAKDISIFNMNVINGLLTV
jgi:hypothetical protein